MTEFAESLLALIVNRPELKMTGVQIVVIVSPKFLKTASGNVQQIDFHLRTGLPVFAALHDISLSFSILF